MLKKTLFAAALLGMTTAALAHDDYVDVRVISTSPRYVTVSEPRQECWTEREPVSYAPERSIGGAVIGGVAGGLIGNQVGHGNGTKVAIAIGSATGAVVGDRIDNRDVRVVSRERTIQRCRTVESQRRVVDGYDVVYRYGGDDRVTVLPYYPGPVIRLPVREIYVVDDRRDRGWHRGWDRHEHRHHHRHHDD